MHRPQSMFIKRGQTLTRFIQVWTVQARHSLPTFTPQCLAHTLWALPRLRVVGQAISGGEARVNYLAAGGLPSEGGKGLGGGSRGSSSLPVELQERQHQPDEELLEGLLARFFQVRTCFAVDVTQSP